MLQDRRNTLSQKEYTAMYGKSFAVSKIKCVSDNMNWHKILTRQHFALGMDFFVFSRYLPENLTTYSVHCTIFVCHLAIFKPISQLLWKSHCHVW